MSRVTVFVLAIAIGLLAFPGAGQEASDTLPGILDEREQRIRERYEQALERNPFQEQAFDRVYESYLSVEGIDAWAQVLTKRVDAATNDSVALTLLGRIRERQFQTEEAVSYLERARNSGEVSVGLNVLLGSLYYQTGRDQQAIDLFEDSLDSVADAEDRARVCRMLGALNMRRGDPDAAIASWKRLIELNPSDLFMQVELAEIYEDNRLWDEAIGTYQRILELSANDPYRRCRSLRSIGRCYIELENYPQAIATFEEAMDIAAPGNWLFEDLKQRLVSVYQDLGDLKGLADYLVARLDDAPADIELRDLLAATYSRMGKLEESETEYRTILERYPGRTGTYERLIELYTRSGNGEQLIQTYEDLIEQYPTEPDYLRRLGEVYLQDNEPGRAKATWERWIADDRGAKRLAEIAAWYEAYEFPEDAIRLYREALGIEMNKEWTFRMAPLQLEAGDEKAALATWRSSLSDTSTAADYVELAALLGLKGFHEEAEPLLSVALEKEPDEAEIWLAIARNLTRQERHEDAVPHYERLAAMTENDYFMERGERGLLESYSKLNILEEKRQEWEKEAVANPESAPVLIRLARMYDRSGDRENALSLYQRCTELEPENAEYLRILADTYRRMKHYDEAIQLFVRLQETDKNRATAYDRELLDIYLVVDMRDEAVATARKIVEKTPGDAEARLDLAQVYQTYLMPDDALSEYRRALRLEPNEPRYHEVYAQALSAEQRWGEAQEAYRNMLQAAREDDTRRSAITQLAGIYLQQGQLEELIGEFQRRIRNTPKKFVAYEELAAVYREAGETTRGIETLEEGLMASDDKIPALRSLIRATHEAEQLDKVVTYYQDLIARSGEPSPFEYERLGNVYARMGEIDTARETWAKMVEADPENARLRKRLAKVLQEQGFTEEAAAARESALELNPHDYQLRYEHAQQLAGIDQMDRALEQLYLLLELGERKAQNEEASKEKQVKRRHRGSRYANQAYMYSAHYRPSNYGYFGGTSSAQYQQFRRSVIGTIASMAENSVGVDSVIEDFQARVDASPADFDAKQDLLVVLQAANRAEPALALAEEIVSLRPNDVDVLEQMSLIYSWQQQTDKSIELLERLAELQPSQRKQRLTALLSLHQRAGNKEEVDALAARILEDYSDDYMMLSQLIGAYQYANDYDKIAELEPYIEKMDPKFKSAYRTQIARALAQGDDKDRARELYRETLFETDAANPQMIYRSVRPKVYAPSLTMQSGYFYGNRAVNRLRNSGIVGQFDYNRSSAMQELYQLAEGDEERDTLWDELYVHASRYQSASTKKERRNAWETGKLLAMHSIGEQEFDRAIALLQDFRDWGEDSIEWFNLAAFTHEQREHFDDMMAVYEEYGDRHPVRSIEILQAKTNVAFAANDFDMAEANIEQYFNRAVPPKVIMEALQRLYDSEEFDRARRLLDKHLQGMNRSSDALLLLARLHANENEYDEALDTVREAWSRKAHGPRSSGRYYGGYYGYYGNTGPNELLSTMHAYAKEAGKTSELIDEFKDRLAKQPGSVQRYEDLANLHRLQRDWDDAIAVYENLIEKRPHLIRAQTSMAELLVNSGKPKKAMEIYEAVMAKSPGAYRNIRWRVRDLYQRTGKGEELAKAEESMMKQATNPNQMRDLAYDFLNRGEHEKAVELFEKIIKMDPSQIHMNSQLATSYVALGRIDDALATYTRYIESPTQRSRGYIDMYALDNMVQLYAGSGRMDELVERNSAQLEKDSKDKLALAIQAKIAKRQHRFDEAYDLFVDIADIPNVGQYALNDLLEIAQFTGREDEVLALLEDRKLTQNYWDMNRLAEFYLTKGEREKAFDAWMKLPQRQGGGYGYEMAFDALIQRNMWAEASTFFEKNRRTIMTDLSLMNQIGGEIIGGYMTRRGFDQAVEELLANGVKGVTLLLVQGIADADNDISRAREIIEPLIEIEPDNSALLGVVANMLHEGGYWSEALPHYQTLVRTANRSGKYTQNYADCLAQLGRERQALSVLRSWVKKKPDESRYRALINQYKAAGQLKAALDLEAEALAEIDESDRISFENMFAAIKTEQGDTQAERDAARKAFESSPDAQTFQRYFTHLHDQGLDADAHALIEAHKDDGYIDRWRTRADSIIDVGMTTGSLDVALDLSWQYLRYGDQWNRKYYSSQVADSYSRLGKGDALVSAFEARAAEEDPLTTGVQQMLAAISAATGDHERALAQYRMLLDQNPYDRETRAAAAEQMRKMRRFEDEAAFWAEGIGSMSLRDEANDAIAQARAWFEAGNPDKGEETLQALREWAQDSETAVAIGSLYHSLGDFEKARAELERGIGPHNRSLRPGFELAQIYARLGENNRAVELWGENQFNSSYRNFPNWLLEQGLYDVAIPALEDALTIRPLVVDSYVKLAQAIHGKDASDAYRERFAEGWERMPPTRREELVKGYATFLIANDLVDGFMQSGAHQEDPVLARALATAFRAQSESKDEAARTSVAAFENFAAPDADAALAIGQAMKSFGENEKATSWLERAATDENAPYAKRVDALLALADVGAYDTAFAAIAELVKPHPGVLVRDPGVMEILARTTDSDRAKELLAPLPDLCPFEDHVEYWNTLFEFHSGGKEAALDRLAESAPVQRLSHAQLTTAANLLEEEGRAEDALRIWTRIAGGGYGRSERDEALKRIVAIQLKHNNLDGAIQSYARLVPLASGTALDAAAAIADYASATNLDTAKQVIQKLIESDAAAERVSDLGALYAQLAERVGDSVSAAALLESAGSPVDEVAEAALWDGLVEDWRFTGPSTQFVRPSADAELPDAVSEWAAGNGAGLSTAERELSSADTLGIVNIQETASTVDIDFGFKIGYATATVESQTAGVAEFVMGSENPIAVWVNGKRVHDSSGSDAVHIGQERFFANLDAGHNTIVVKLMAADDAWRFSLGRVDRARTIRQAKR